MKEYTLKGNAKIEDGKLLWVHAPSDLATDRGDGVVSVNVTVRQCPETRKPVGNWQEMRSKRYELQDEEYFAIVCLGSYVPPCPYGRIYLNGKRISQSPLFEKNEWNEAKGWCELMIERCRKNIVSGSKK